jgi:hypothetical protein
MREEAGEGVIDAKEKKKERGGLAEQGFMGAKVGQQRVNPFLTGGANWRPFPNNQI